MRTAGLIGLSLGHKRQFPIALTWGGTGDVTKELLDACVTQGAPEGASCKHVENGVNSAADEDHGSSNKDCSAPDTLQIFCFVVVGAFNGQDDE